MTPGIARRNLEIVVARLLGEPVWGLCQYDACRTARTPPTLTPRRCDRCGKFICRSCTDAHAAACDA